MTKKIVDFFDKLEDKTRSRLSKSPLLYGLLGGIGMVLFWRGVWHTNDYLILLALGQEKLNLVGLLDGPLSFLLGSAILLVTGVFVSTFIGNRFIISGLSGEKKLAEQNAEEIESEEIEIKKIQKTLENVEEELSKIEAKIDENK